jgi:hypothetical protein
LVRFGYDPDWILTRDFFTFEGAYCSAMRCWYLDKAEDLNSLHAAVASAFAKKGSNPVGDRVKMFDPMLSSRDCIVGDEPETRQSAGRGSAADFMRDVGAGKFRGVK